MKYILLLLLTSSSITFAQEHIPEGWDKVYFEDEIAYMNVNTGNISKTLPRGVARRSVEKSVSYNNSSGSGVHYVEKGDTYSKISRKYNISLSELYSLNDGRNFNKIKVGDEVVIGNATLRGEGDFHVVRKRETLFSISRIYGLSINELKSMNSLSSNDISVGQKLNIR